ncbi:MAG: hypothetical protein AAF222_08635, partial [Pseudomonadota bacterium]
ETAEPVTSRRLSEVTPFPNEPQHTAELVALPPLADAPQATPMAQTQTHAGQRRTLRPLGMAMVLLLFASLPLTTEAPPLETGPAMPAVDTLRVQPALGVTWSLNAFPFQTSSSQWRPASAPPVLTAPPASERVDLAVSPRVGRFVAPSALPAEELNWNGVVPVAPAPFDAVPLPALGPDTVPQPVDPVPPLAAPDSTVAAPPRPTLPVEESVPVVPADPPELQPETVRPSETVVEADQLRVTILAPTRVDQALTNDIANGIVGDGHELVRVRSVDYSISERNVRYFHAQDRAAAARFAARYGAELRDFTWFRPSPVVGTTELWLAGTAPGGNTNGRTQPRNGAGNRGEFLGNVFNRLGLGTELPENLPGANTLRNVFPRVTGGN